MANELPEIIEFTGSGVTEGDFKIAMGKQRMYLDSLLGSDGLPNTANAKLGTARNSVLTKTESYIATAVDKGKVIRFTGDAELILSFSAAMSLGNGWSISVINDSTADLTIDPYLGESIDGMGTLKVKAAGRVEVVCDGTMFYTASKAIEEDEEVVIPHGMQAFTASGTFVVPEGVTQVFVELCGGGGGGSGGIYNKYAGSGGATSFGTYLTATGGTGGGTNSSGVFGGGGGSPYGEAGVGKQISEGAFYAIGGGAKINGLFGKGGSSYNSTRSCGGGSGGYNIASVGVMPGEVIQITVGAAGSAGDGGDRGNQGACLVFW